MRPIYDSIIFKYNRKLFFPVQFLNIFLIIQEYMFTVEIF